MTLSTRAPQALFAGGLVLAAAIGTAEAQQAARTELVLCNKTGQNIDIAVAYMDAGSGRWTLSAWHKRTPGECKSFGAVKTGLFYYHAKNERGAVWPNQANTDRRYCVPSTAVRRDMSSQCGRGEINRPFRGRVMEPGKFTFSFS
ncbi:MAG: DUF1036 domain-containing protein [Beijerinckiaceae bacterium]